MADVVLSLAVVGDSNPLPVPVTRGEGVTLRVTATDRISGALVTVTGLRLIVRSPSAETVYSGTELASGGIGVWTREVTLDQRGRWYVSAECDIPGPATADTLPLRVLASLADLPVPVPPAPAVVDAAQSAAAAAQSAAEAEAAAASIAGLANSPMLSYATRTAAVAAAAAGSILDNIETIWTTGYATANDGGAAAYIWVASDPGHDLAFPNAGPRGGWFEIDEPVLSWEMAGGFGVPLGQTPTVSMRAAVDRLVDYGWTKGGMAIRSGLRRYLIGGTTPVDFPPGTRISGGIPAGIAQFDPDSNVIVDWARAPAIYLAQGVTLGLSGACEIDECVILHASLAGLSISTPALQLAYQRDLRTRGTGLHLGRDRPAPDAAVRGCIICGFDIAIVVERAEWGLVEGNKLDANYGVKVLRNGTPVAIERNFCQSFVDTRVETEVTNRTFSAGALSNVDGNVRLMLPPPGIDWLEGGTIAAENVVRLRDLANGTSPARTALSSTLNVRRVSATEFDLVGEVIPGVSPRTEAPIAWVDGMEAVTGRLEVKTGLKQFFRAIASVAASPDNKPRVTLAVPFPPFGLTQIYVAGMRLGGASAETVAAFNNWHLATRVTDTVWDLPLDWTADMANITGQIHAYCNVRLGAVETEDPGTGVWLSSREVDGARIISNNFKGPVRGFVNLGDFTRYDLNSYEPGRAGADTVPLPRTIGVLTTNDLIGTASQHKGPAQNVVSRNPSREGVHMMGVHMRTSGPEILRLEEGSMYVMGGRNNAGGGAGTRSAISILPNALKLSVIGGDFTNVEVMDPTGGPVHPRAKFSFIGPRPSYAEEDSADLVIVGANFEVFAENWPGDVGEVPTIGARFRSQRWDGTNALTAGQVIGRLSLRGYTGASAGTERTFVQWVAYADAIGASADGSAGLQVLAEGAMVEAMRASKTGVTLRASPLASSNDLSVPTTAWVLARIAEGVTALAAADISDFNAATQAAMAPQIASLQQQINAILAELGSSPGGLGVAPLPLTLA